MPSHSPAMQAFSAREDLEKYGDNALLLFALELKWDIEDIYSTASQALIDGANDKKCDLLYVDRERGVAVLAQGYMASKPKEAASANKAADLNTAASWMLAMPLEQLPERLRSAANELRSALNDGVIRGIEFWYVHNCPESDNVKKELASVSMTARNAVNTHFSTSSCDEIRATEIGQQTLDEWYKAIKTPILVTESFELDVAGGYEVTADQWKAFSTAIPATWLHTLYKKHRTNLFSANVRDYLGGRVRDSQINFGIRQTVESDAQQFWAFNNGITAIVNQFEVRPGGKRLRIHGISIVNGAQTTGAIGSLSNPPDPRTMIQARFIKCSDPIVIENIVRYNNSQNKIEISDFRSSDPIQQRLRKEFEHHPARFSYSGGRRGSTTETNKRSQNLTVVPVDTVAQSLMSFHGNPTLAYQQVGKIWQSDRDYSLIFHEATHADHLIFVYSLNRTISAMKDPLVKRGEDTLTSSEKEILKFLRLRGSQYILLAAVGTCMETFLQQQIPSKFLLRFSRQGSLNDYEKCWRPVVEACIPFSPYLEPPLGNALKIAADVKLALADFRRHVDSGKRMNESIYRTFASQVTLTPWPTINAR